MFTSFEEFKFFQSFRIPVEANDDVRCMIEFENEFGKFEYIKDAKLEDVSITGIGFITSSRLSVGTNIRMSINFKRLRIDIEGHVVRSFGYEIEEDIMLYGIEVDSEDQNNMRRFLEQYTSSFSPDRARECLTNLALSERYKKATESIEVFSLMLSLFKDITSFGSQESFLNSMLEEITRILNAQRASIFLINPQTNELEAVSALGTDKEILKFDYRKGIAGSVFTTGVALNIDCKTDKVRFNEDFDEKTGFQTRSILCNPITNREDKVIGVMEVLNKRNEDRFTMEDEKTMKVLSLIFSSVFHNYNPISEKSMIRRFSTPYDREHAYIGRSPQTNEMRKAILKLKDIDTCLTIQGEPGSGKRLMAQIIHNEGKRGLNPYEVINCKGVDHDELWKKIIGADGHESLFEKCIGGTVVFHEIGGFPLVYQDKLIQILKERRIEGSNITLDNRVIFTSSIDLNKLAHEDGQFNLDLLDYLSTSVLNVVPLRKRAQDIDDLLSYFLRKQCRKQGLLLKEFSDEVKQELRAYDWPGNIAELQRAVEKAVLYNPKAHVITKLKTGGATPIVDMSKASIKGLDNIPHARDFNIPLKDRVALVEREMILAEIKRNGGNKSKAAKEMGISREALRKKLLISDAVLEDLEKDKNQNDEKSAA